MKKIVSFCISFLLVLGFAKAQNKTFSIGTSSPNTNAALHIESPTNNQGLLMPRLTTTQRTAMTLTASDRGMSLYDITLKAIFVWDGTSWNIPSKTKYLISDPASLDTVLTAKTFSNKPHSFAISGIHKGTGDAAGFFMIDNPASSNAALVSQTNGSGSAISAFTVGTGAAASFISFNPSSGQAGVYGQTDGAGAAGVFFTFGTGSGITATNWGPSGAAGVFHVDYETNASDVVSASTNGTGRAGSFAINNAASTAPALYVTTNGTGRAGLFESTNPNANNRSLYVTSQSNVDNMDAFTAVMYGTGGAAGAFDLESTTSFRPALFAQTGGQGDAAYFTHNGSNGNILNLLSNWGTVARVDRSGKGFFNGGTQTGGADLAELFSVEGIPTQYEPGDVLVISASTDRTIEKSSQPNSTMVAGVYATKPGVTLTERGSEESIDDLVPLGVIGVIPTKVCLENGPIKRGDLLVTSSIAGHAMKAISSKMDGVFPSGVILGKALENYDGTGKGLIKVLVNVK